MATNNLFLGSGTGSVGDVTLMRRNNKQVARVRIRTISNPRSESQSTQRSLFAPVSKFYSPLASVLEKSWEGKNRADSFSAFLKANLNLAKANNWSLPKGTGFFPLPYQLSEGTIMPLSQYFDGAEQAIAISMAENVPTVTSLGEISRTLINAGYKDGDQLTFIFVVAQNISGATIYAPVSYRCYLDSASDVSFSTLFPAISVSVDDNRWLFSLASQEIYAGAVIVSRYENEKWRRSTTFLGVETILMEAVAAGSEDAIASYMNSSSTPASDVYLNGSTSVDNGGSSIVDPSLRAVFVGSETMTRDGNIDVAVSADTNFDVYAINLAAGVTYGVRLLPSAGNAIAIGDQWTANDSSFEVGQGITIPASRVGTVYALQLYRTWGTETRVVDTFGTITAVAAS